jgi:glycosyltransferase involved in cell wall biosynthesis
MKILMLGTGLDVKGGVTSVEKLIINNAGSDVQIRHIPTVAQGSALHNIMVFFRAIQALCGAIIQKEVDIIHIHFSERGSTLRKSVLISIGLLFRQPIIIHAHGATYQEFYAGLPRFVQKILVAIIGRSTRIIVLSKSWQTYYSDTFNLTKDRVITLYNPVDLPSSIPNRCSNREVILTAALVDATRTQSQSQGYANMTIMPTQQKKLKFIFLGRIGKRGGALDVAKSLMSFPQQDKGAFDLINAFAELAAEDRDRVELFLAGNGDLAAANELITELNLTDKITILDWLNPQQRDALLAEADGFILPSYNEGLPMSMLESMAWGLPVIVTPVGGIPEVITHKQNGLLVEPGNREQLVAAMQSLIRDEDLRISLGMAARQSVEGLDIHSYMKSLVEVYTSVIEERKTS